MRAHGHSFTVLLAEDDDSLCAVLEQAIAQQGWQCLRVDNGRDLAVQALLPEVALVITDVMMPLMDGLDALDSIRQARPHLPVIVISAQRALVTSLEARERGAQAFFAKPFDLHALLDSAKTLLANAPESTTEEEAKVDLVAFSSAMCATETRLHQLAPLAEPVLFCGEAGSGKAVAARYLHGIGSRSAHPFIIADLSGNGIRDAAGLHQVMLSAQSGSFYIDEVADLPLSLQAALFQALSTPSLQGVRVLAASAQSLTSLCQRGLFRKDLYFRLQACLVEVPPLRARREDILPLAQALLRDIAQEKSVLRFTPEAEALLLAHAWPGNVRALHDCMRQICLHCTDNVISDALLRLHLPANVPKEEATLLPQASLAAYFEHWLAKYFASHSPGLPPNGLYGQVLQQIEPVLIRHVLDAVGQHQLKTSEILGINRNTLRKKMQDYELFSEQGRRRG